MLVIEITEASPSWWRAAQGGIAEERHWAQFLRQRPAHLCSYPRLRVQLAINTGRQLLYRTVFFVQGNQHRARALLQIGGWNGQVDAEVIGATISLVPEIANKLPKPNAAIA